MRPLIFFMTTLGILISSLGLLVGPAKDQVVCGVCLLVNLMLWLDNAKRGEG